MPAMLFGSISTIADTSELQRQAFNEAFETHGLDWRWEQEEYRDLLRSSGGSDRVAEYARSRGESVDADAVHRSKSELFQKHLGEAGLTLRPGVAATLKQARDNGFKVAFVTTTAPENVAALLDGLDDLSASDFDLVVDRTAVEQPKPDAAVYAYALDQLGETADGCVAIEDNLGGVQSAAAAGVPVIAFPNTNTAGHDFDQADRRVDALDFADVQSAVVKG
jgi:HAD superfamily hydrolase (TIGR01509 family)